MLPSDIEKIYKALPTSIGGKPSDAMPKKAGDAPSDTKKKARIPSYKRLLHMAKSIPEETFRLVQRADPATANEATAESSYSHPKQIQPQMKRKSVPITSAPTAKARQFPLAASGSRSHARNVPFTTTAQRTPSHHVISKRSTSKKLPKNLVQANTVKRDIPRIEDVQDEISRRKGAIKATNIHHDKRSQSILDTNREPMPSRARTRITTTARNTTSSSKAIDIDKALANPKFIEKNYSSVIQQMMGRRPNNARYESDSDDNMEASPAEMRREELRR